MASKNILSLREKMQVAEKLQEVLTIVDEKSCYYTDGLFNDETLAAWFSFDCTKANVAGVRQELFGNIPVGGANTGVSVELGNRLAEIEKRLDRLQHFCVKHLGMKEDGE